MLLQNYYFGIGGDNYKWTAAPTHPLTCFHFNCEKHHKPWILTVHPVSVKLGSHSRLFRQTEASRFVLKTQREISSKLPVSFPEWCVLPDAPDLFHYFGIIKMFLMERGASAVVPPGPGMAGSWADLFQVLSESDFSPISAWLLCSDA